ncbi:ABC transporter permease [Zongyangia hominis]|uniref:Transport permease protein n=1 Tax=Zongyangia hominis TaxID=2763677 RepID=A0A926EDK5_9FIRM|nr:ABC transporter permease [Zongyangia hominis]MBC8571103.1 ABC transporter permease [Zongyangia hominis]
MKSLAFASRTRKEVTRDPLTLLFGIGFPVVLILLISLMKRSLPDMPNDVFGIQGFAPGMAVFGLSFISLFLGMLIAKDRDTSFLMRLFASPLKGSDYILGYSLPFLPIALLQGAVCFGTALFFGLTLNIHLLSGLLMLLPVSLLFIAMGLLLGSFFTYTQVGGISSILVNVAAWMSGTWFDLALVGGAFKTVCYLLPFAHAVDTVKYAIAGNYAAIGPHLLWVLGYATLLYTGAVWVFRRKMKN